MRKGGTIYRNQPGKHYVNMSVDVLRQNETEANKKKKKGRTEKFAVCIFICDFMKKFNNEFLAKNTFFQTT